MFYRRCKLIVLVEAIALVYAISLSAQSLEGLTEEQMRDFLINAKVVRSRQTGKGITNPYRLTLSNGNLVHDASFQTVDTHRSMTQFFNGKTEMNFRDSYKYNIAAFELAKMVGLGDMMPVTVERKWDGKTGALSWWLPAKMDQEQMHKERIKSPDAEAFNKQMYKILVFVQLVYDTDRNQGNILISEDWHLWMIDFTRAFRLSTSLQNPKDLVKCDRMLLQRLRQLDAAELERRTKNWLNSMEIKSMMARRDKIVALFESLIAQKGEREVLYD